ncbi:unnamed protein product [Caenorhabditis auriculariae]|uniref:Galectin n=1 Tax=Caenorhabditis auriculariae TaxID=2777116 RepID=A0A8S1HUJ6_9PELO|nr:unnamed protein product [Caenorhabditis auriculariae]
MRTELLFLFVIGVVFSHSSKLNCIKRGQESVNEANVDSTEAKSLPVRVKLPRKLKIGESVRLLFQVPFAERSAGNNVVQSDRLRCDCGTRRKKRETSKKPELTTHHTTRNWMKKGGLILVGKRETKPCLCQNWPKIAFNFVNRKNRAVLGLMIDSQDGNLTLNTQTKRYSADLSSKPQDIVEILVKIEKEDFVVTKNDKELGRMKHNGQFDDIVKISTLGHFEVFAVDWYCER